MTSYRDILKKVGIAWVVFGLADIVFMIYTIAHGRSYSSSFNIFAVIVGIFLIRGSLGATRLVTWFSAFTLTAFIGVLLVFPFLQPIGFLLLQAKLDPLGSAITWLMSAIVLALLGWSYRQLRSPAVLEARRSSGRTTAAPKLAFGLGAALVVFLAIMLGMTLKGATGAKAVELARQQLGPDYKYLTQSFSSGGGHTSAVVAAYNDHEIKYVPVAWDE
jgi:hypothetical protein